jgi:hypothetical protein
MDRNRTRLLAGVASAALLLGLLPLGCQQANTPESKGGTSTAALRDKYVVDVPGMH